MIDILNSQVEQTIKTKTEPERVHPATRAANAVVQMKDFRERVKEFSTSEGLFFHSVTSAFPHHQEDRPVVLRMKDFSLSSRQVISDPWHIRLTRKAKKESKL